MMVLARGLGSLARGCLSHSCRRSLSESGALCRLKKAVSAAKGEKAALEGEKAALTKAKAALEKEKAVLIKEKAALTGELDIAQKGAEQSAIALAARHKQAAADVSKTMEEIAATEQGLLAVKEKLAALSTDLTASVQWWCHTVVSDVT